LVGIFTPAIRATISLLLRQALALPFLPAATSEADPRKR
jgi:hypothetical protein